MAVFNPSGQLIVQPDRHPEPVMALWMQLITGGLGALNVQGPGPFASLSEPPSGSIGVAVITDSSTATWGAVIAGGGANVVLAWFNDNGDWTVAAK